MLNSKFHTRERIGKIEGEVFYFTLGGSARGRETNINQTISRIMQAEGVGVELAAGANQKELVHVDFKVSNCPEATAERIIENVFGAVEGNRVADGISTDKVAEDVFETLRALTRCLMPVLYHLTHLKNYNLPVLDKCYPALVEDLESRGLLDSTLIVVMGEMGRSPKVNDKAGRDHWPQCGFCLLTGGGVKSGSVFGATDKHAAYPVSDAVSPSDIVATIYHLLGIDSQMTVNDPAGRPIPIAHGGNVIRDVLA